MKVPNHQTFLAWILAVICTFGIAIGETHKVGQSETFYSISRKYKVSVSALMSANGFKDPTTLKVGQKLTIPGKTSKVSSKASSKVTRSSSRPTAKSMRVIVDAGHGGRDRGAVWGGGA